MDGEPFVAGAGPAGAEAPGTPAGGGSAGGGSAGVLPLGTRAIRSSGAGSGSIEVTLPALLRNLQGLPCRIALRDGHRPEIVLQPDLRRAQDAFARLMALLEAALDLDARPFAPTDFSVALRPAAAQLAWEDGLALGLAPPHPADALARCLRGLGQALAARCGIAPGLALGFGATLGWAVAGRVPDPGDQAACDIAAAALGDATSPPAFAGDAFDRAPWDAARPRLRRLVDLHQDWTADPACHAALAAAWRRGVALELSGD